MTLDYSTARNGWIIPTKATDTDTTNLFGTILKYQILVPYFISVIYCGLFHYSDLLTVSKLDLLIWQLIHALVNFVYFSYTFSNSL